MPEPPDFGGLGEFLFGPAARTYVKSVLLRQKGPITEADFTDRELAAMRTGVQSWLNSTWLDETLEGVQPWSGYHSVPLYYNVGGVESEPLAHSLAHTLGATALRLDDEGNLVIRDWYDFHESDEPQGAPGAGVLERLGRTVLPSGSGREVRINLGPAGDFGPAAVTRIPKESALPLPTPERREPVETPLEAVMFGAQEQTLMGKRKKRGFQSAPGHPMKKMDAEKILFIGEN